MIMGGKILHQLLFLYYATFTWRIICANILDVTCINFNPIYDANTNPAYAAILNGADVTSILSFQRNVDLDSGARSSDWCLPGDAAATCGLPEQSVIDLLGRVTLQGTDEDKFGTYGCRAERYNWTTEMSTAFIRRDAHFTPSSFTVTVSHDEEVRLAMNPASTTGTGDLVWILNHESGGQTDLSSDVVNNELYISRANKSEHAGVHHYYYANEPDQGSLLRLIVRGCLDNLWGPECQYTCPACYNGGVCDDVTGRCVCPPGFSGDHCHSACEAGYFGKNCTGSCSTLLGHTNCSEAVFCLSDPYGCSCAAGWTGLECNQACATGFYGAGCKQTCHCDPSGTCDPVTGACSSGCENGWTGHQCQVTILDTTAFLSGAGVGDSNILMMFIIGTDAVGDSSLSYYIGREVDTGAGETGHGAFLVPSDGDISTNWVDTGLPPGTTFIEYSFTLYGSFRALFDNANGGDARVGAYRLGVEYKGWTERTILLNEYRGDSNSEVYPEKLSTTVGVGESVTLNVAVNTPVDTTTLRWRHNDGNEITEWAGQTSITIDNVRKSDEGIYECYVDGNRETGRHAILYLIVRGCPSSKYGFDCSLDCPVCYAGGVCHDITGECVCRASFMGTNCETPCGFNNWGKYCNAVCSSSRPGCASRLFAPPNPVGMACITGYGGNRCQTACDAGKYGAGCEFQCNCGDNDCDMYDGCPSDRCSSNYEGPFCQALEASQDCPPGFFGTLCNFPCHCAGDEPCDRSTGECEVGTQCAHGWAGSNCQYVLPRLMNTPLVSGVTNDSVLLIWDAWIDGYDYGNGPVHSYQIDIAWADDRGNTDSEESIIIVGDSTADITGLFGFRDYEFHISLQREVEGQIEAGVTNGPVTAKTDCGAPLLAPEMLSATVNNFSSITVNWKIPQSASSSWLQCDSTSFRYSLTYWPSDAPDDFRTIRVEDYNNDVSRTIDTLEACTEYIFYLAVVNSIDLSGPANQTMATTDVAPPDSVNDTTIDFNSSNHLEISWAEPSSECGRPRYNITRRVLLIDQCDDSMADVLTWNETEDTSIVYDDLIVYSMYEFTITAILEEYESEMYVLLFNSTESVPTAVPDHFTVDNSIKGELHYSWSRPPCGERKGEIFYYFSFGPMNIMEEDNSTETFSVSGLSHYEEYRFEVGAMTVFGDGPSIVNVTRTLPSEPTIPLQIIGKSTNQTFTLMTWMESQFINGLFERFDLQRDNEEVIEIYDEEQRDYPFPDLEPDMEYDFRIRTVSNGGEGPWANTSVVTPAIPVPDRPGTPETVDQGETYISIRWEPADETLLGIYRITSYNLSVSTDDSTDGRTINIENTTQPLGAIIISLDPGILYYIKVAAINEGGQGPWSYTLTESTLQEAGTEPWVIGVSVGVPILLIILVSGGFLFYRRKRIGPPTPPKEYGMEEVEPTNIFIRSQENREASSDPVMGAITIGASSKSKPPIKEKPVHYPPIQLSNLAKYVKVKRMSPEGFDKEYKGLLNRSDEGCIGTNPENKAKNRYKNVVTYDEHRVKLNKLPTEPGADYINATFINGYKKENAFIASQGPNNASLNDFWQMVYEQRTAVIVMLTNLVEKDKNKCLKYWPAPGKHECYGELEVTGKRVENERSYVLRIFEVGKPGRTPHTVSQYHYTIWPDMGVPESSQPLIDFRDIVKNANPVDAGPIVVHCSAGAGRTGTFITIDSMMEMIETEKKIDIFNFVNDMRKRRAFMVQVQSQYEFIYETLLQWSVSKQVSFKIIDLQTTLKSWKTKDDVTGKSEMMRQFEVLEYMAPSDSIGKDQKGFLPENVKKNRYADLVPDDKSKPLLMTKGDGADDNDYINASFFDEDGRKNAHVCTQCPLMSTIGDFWRLVWDYDMYTLIHLNEMDSTCGQYWPDADTVNFGSFTVELLTEKRITDTLIERILKVTTSRNQGERHITQYQYFGWPNGSLVPTSKMEFLDVIMQADGNNNSPGADKKKFLIVCMDGVGASPTCLAAIATLDKVKEDKTVDVFSAVKRLRKSRPGVVDKLERYMFCFDVLAAYQDSVQTYANYM